MRRMSSPGMYPRCCAKSVDAPRCGDLCNPLMNPSTTVRASSSRFPIRARIDGSRKDRWSGATAVVMQRSHAALRHRNDAKQLLDHLIGRDLLRFGVEVHEHAMAHDGLRERADVLEAHVEPPVHERARLSAEDEMLRRARAGAVRDPLLDEVRGL